jgi:VPDSG-CTERM motif
MKRIVLMAAIAAAFVTQPVFGIPMDHQLVFTENSSSSLSVTYDGTAVPVTFSGLESFGWGVSGVPVNLSPSGFMVSWFEPGSALSFNIVFEFPASGDFAVLSDRNFTRGRIKPNGSTFVNAGIDNRDGVGVDITFRDHGDVATTPDTGTTCSLLGFSLMGLAFLRRKLC